MFLFLKILSTALCLYMSYVAISTSLQSNLFEVGGELLQIPWMVATLKDFYINTLIIYLWVFYKEEHWWTRVLWLVLLATLGSIATSFYLLIQLFKAKPNDPIEVVLLRTNRPAVEA